MIKRIVFWKVAGDTWFEKSKNALRMKELLESLSGKIPGLLSLEVAINERKSDDSSDVVFITCFRDDKSVSDYDDHPEHVKIKSEVKGLRTERRVVAYEVEDFAPGQ
jgi:hypothetical protein